METGESLPSHDADLVDGEKLDPNEVIGPPRGLIERAEKLSGVNDVIKITGRGANFVRVSYPFLYPITLAVNAIGIATAATELVGDTGGRLVNRL